MEFNFNKYVSDKKLLKEEETHPNMAPGTADKETYNLKTLSPDEQTKLKEYISSIKEIKKEINELMKKAKGAKVEGGNWGGPRKDMVMPVAEKKDKKKEEEEE
jgi:vancomycin resistance protein YoaR